MADENTTIAAFEGALKEDYIGVINQQFPVDSPLDSILENNTEDVEGTEAVMSLALAPNLGVGYASEDGILPDAGYPTIKKVRLALAYLYGSFQLSGQVIRASKSSRGAFAPAMTTIMEDLLAAMKKLRNFYNYGDGSGAIAQVLTVPTATTMTVDRSSPLFDDARKLDSFTAKDGTGTKNMDAKTISSFDKSTLTLTTTASHGASVGDYIYLKGSRNNVQMGLLGGVDDGTFVNTFQGLSRSTYKRWKANVFHNNGAVRNLTENLILGAIAAARMVDSKIDLWVGTPFQLNDLVEDMQVLRQFVNVKKYSGAIRAVDLGGVMFTEDPDALPGYTFGLSKKDISYFSAGPIDWMKEPGANNILQRVITASGKKDAFEGTAILYRQMGFKRCNSHVRLEDIAENAPVGYK